ncbi:MAG TPA: Ig-like domain repeat protein [Pyrinomonadaceae bacterium]|nr:Ig-like domain repeat protein [Pyrinomonadaceae bacterium]
MFILSSLKTLRSKFSASPVCLVVLCLFAIAPENTFAQAPGFGGNAQHTSSYPAPAQNLITFKWITSIDFNNTGALIHYGAPLVTNANTVLVPIKTGATDGFQVSAFNGASGASKYSVSTDYILPTHNWIPAYQPTVATGSFGTRMYYAGAGGTIFHIDNPDSNSHGTPVREVFYTSLANYNANAAAFNATVFVNSPITADASGNIYFSFRVQGSAPAPLNTTQSGFARIDVNGVGTYVLAGAAANDAQIDSNSHNVAPAISNDGTTVYVAVRRASLSTYGYLLGLDTTTLATKYSVFLRDPRNTNGAQITEDGTSSPMVAPDGDVYFGVRGNPNNGSRGFLLRFSGDLTVTKTPGAFGWDYTPGIVPATSVPSYAGPSTYLLFCKYNDYAFQDGTGVNRVAILDPNTTQVDPHTGSAGLVEMREVLTASGPTPDAEAIGAFPLAVREFCINTPAVNAARNSVFFNSEDGHAYRWNLATNTLDQALSLNSGIGQPYVPTVIGPDGTIFTLNGGTLFALGNHADSNITLASSSPDMRENVSGNSITFTATVTGAPNPTGTVSFSATTYKGTDPQTITLATNVPLNANGQASVTTSALTAGGSVLGNHFVTAFYSGDGTHASAFGTMVQKVHANASSTTLQVSPNPVNPGQPVTLTATVTGIPSGTPTGMVTFRDGINVVGQVPLENGVASLQVANLFPGGHNLFATYASDTRFATSSAGNTLSVNQPNVQTQFSAGGFSSSESSPMLNVEVTRTGDTAFASTVDYATSDPSGGQSCDFVGDIASSRCDYIMTLGTLRFAPGETTKTISIPLIDDVYLERSESFAINLSNPSGSVLGLQDFASVTITDNDASGGNPNPIDSANFFVRQHYVDFLNREPDSAGLAFWTNQINECNGEPTCVEIRRINVSAAFFLSIEFQETGYLVYRTYKTAFGNLTNPPGAPVPVKFVDFLRDAQQMQQGVQVGIGNWQLQLEANKAAYALAFVQRADFLAAYPGSLTADQFVTQLNNNAGGVLSSSEKANLVAILGTTPADLPKRASVLRSISEDADLKNAEKNKAFVLMQYFGYLRRNPYDPPEINLDYSGFNFWLNKLNQANGNFVNADMVKSFLVSGEYRHRFGL